MLGFGLLWCFCRQNFHHLPCTSEKWGQRNVGQKHSCHSVGKLKHRTLSISLSYTPRETASFLDISQVKIRRAMTQCCCDEGWFYLTYRNIFSWHFWKRFYLDSEKHICQGVKTLSSHLLKTDPILMGRDGI